MTDPPPLLSSNNLEEFSQDDHDDLVASVAELLVAFGDGPAPLKQTATIITAELISYIKTMLRRALVHRQTTSNLPGTSSGLPIDVSDVLSVLKEDGEELKYQRCCEILQNWDELHEMLTGFEFDESEQQDEEKRRKEAAKDEHIDTMGDQDYSNT